MSALIYCHPAGYLAILAVFPVVFRSLFEIRNVSYYHLMNRVAGEPGEYPLGDVEKEKLLRLAVELSRFYSLELLSFVCMGNHWHAVCFAPAELPSRQEVIAGDQGTG